MGSAMTCCQSDPAGGAACAGAGRAMEAASAAVSPAASRVLICMAGCYARRGPGGNDPNGGVPMGAGWDAGGKIVCGPAGLCGYSGRVQVRVLTFGVLREIFGVADVAVE